MAVALPANATRDTVRDLQDIDASLATYAWLAAVSPDMEVAAFARRVSASFVAWPTQLLEAQVNYPNWLLVFRDCGIFLRAMPGLGFGAAAPIRLESRFLDV